MVPTLERCQNRSTILTWKATEVVPVATVPENIGKSQPYPRDQNTEGHFISLDVTLLHSQLIEETLSLHCAHGFVHLEEKIHSIT